MLEQIKSLDQGMMEVQFVVHIDMLIFVDLAAHTIQATEVQEQGLVQG